MNQEQTTLKTYLLEGKPLHKMSRARLALHVRRLHERSRASDQRIFEAELDLAVVSSERDQYKKESVDRWCRLTTSETELSKAEARYGLLLRENLRLEKLVSVWAIFRYIASALFWLGVAVALIVGVAVWS